METGIAPANPGREVVSAATLTLRELNRATLARQMLLERASLPVTGAVARLVGLQAQVANPPYVGLWTRLERFRHEDLTRHMEERRVVRATLMRSTLHLMTAEDYLSLRPALQPALTRALGAFFGPRAKGLDIERLVAAAREYFEEEPRTFAELRALLSGIEPDRDPEALAYAVRTHLPLVQVPPSGTWGYGGRLAYTPAESWLGRPPSSPGGLRELILRYLAAFGPASVKDLQAWSGMGRLKGAVAELEPDLRPFRDEKGRELLDLPDAPHPGDLAGLPAPARFLPDYDNLLLAYADRRRVVADEHRPGVSLSAGRVRATFLLDGFVRGTWKTERARGRATLVIEPFVPLAKKDRDVLTEEGQRLLHFVESGSEKEFGIRFDDRRARQA